MTKGQKEQEAQSKYMELQMLDQQVKQVQTQLKTIEQQAEEMESVAIQLDEFNTLKPGSEALIPVANGIFTKAILQEPTSFVVNVGANTMVAKSLEETKKVLIRQVEEMHTMQQELTQKIMELATKAKNTQEELRTLVE